MARTDNVQINLNINGSRAISELNLLQSEAGKLRESMKGLRRGTEEYASLDKQLKEVTKAMKAQQDQIGLNGMTIAQLTYKKNQLTAEIRKNLVPATDEYIKKTAELQKVNARLNELRGSVQQVSSVWDQLKSRFAVTFDVGNMLARGVDNFSNTLRASVGIASELSDKYADIQKSTQMTAKEVDNLRVSLQQIDSRTVLTDLLDMAKVAGQMGVAKNQLRDFVVGIDQAKVALGDEFKGTVEDLAKELVKVVNLFPETKSLPIGEAIKRVGSAMNELGAAGVATGGYIADFTKRMGQLPQGIAPSLTKVMGMGAALEELGLTSEIAAGGLTNVFLKMGQNSEAFAKQMGMSKKQFQDLFNKDSSEAVLRLAETFKGLSGIQLEESLKRLGLADQEAIKVMGALAGSTSLVTERQALSNKEYQKGISLFAEFSIKNTTVAAELSKAGKQAYNFGFAIGQVLAPAVIILMRLFGNFLGMLTATPAFIRQNIVAVTAITTAFLAYNASIIANTTATIANAIATRAFNALVVVGTVAVGAYTAVVNLLTSAQARQAVAQRVLNFVMSANPVGAVITALGLLASGFAYLYTQTGSVIGVFKGLGSASVAVVSNIGKLLSLNFSGYIKSIRDAYNEASGLERKALQDFADGTKDRIKATEERIKATQEKMKKEEEAKRSAQQEAENVARAEALNRQKEFQQKNEELAREAEQKRKEAREKSLEADKAREDLRIALIKDAYDREIAETTVATARKIEESNKEFAFIKANAQYNQAELATKTQEHNDYLALLEQQKADKIAEINTRRIEEQRQREEEERTRTVSQLTTYLEEDLAREQSDIEAKYLQKQMLIEEQYAGEDEQFWARVEALRVAEDAARTAELDAQRTHLENKMFLLRSAGEQQTAEYRKLAAQLVAIDVEKNQKEVENRRRSIELQKKLEQEKLGVAQDALRLGIEILSEDEQAKKKHATALKLLTIADISIGLVREVQGIWENANKSPINAIVPGWGPIFAGVQTGIATARAFMGIRKVASTEYEKGGFLKVKQFAMGGMLRGDGVLPTTTTHAQGGLHVIDNRTGKKVAEFEGREGIIFSKTAIKNNPHLWQPLLHSSMYRQGAPVAPRKYRDGGTMGSPQTLPVSLPTASPASLELSQANEDMRILIAETRNLIGIIAQSADSFKQVYISYYELEEKFAEMQRRRTENSSS